MTEQYPTNTTIAALNTERLRKAEADLINPFVRLSRIEQGIKLVKNRSLEQIVEGVMSHLAEQVRLSRLPLTPFSEPGQDQIGPAGRP